MQVFKFLTVAMLVFVVSIGVLDAKSLRNAGEPAEFPPSSFKGKQYVDSKGCVFIRAGISGNVTWVPRVSRSREQICRQKPTFARAAKPDVAVVAERAPTPVAKPAAKPAPVRAKPVPVRVKPTPVRVKPAAKPAPMWVTAPKTLPAPKRVVRAPIAKPAPQPRRILRRVAKTPIVAAPTPVVTAKPVVAPKPIQRRVVQAPARQGVNSCQNGSVYNQVYNNNGTMTVRCGPQVADPTGGYVYNAPANPAPTIKYVPTNSVPAVRVPRTQTRRIATPKPTRAVAIAAAQPAPSPSSPQRALRIDIPAQPPAGYVRVWTDGRLNPNRARGTAAGQVDMEMIWTNTVPRRLVSVSTSQDTRRRVVVHASRKIVRRAAVVSTKTAPSSRSIQRPVTMGGDR